jgi:hypothetical protein
MKAATKSKLRWLSLALLAGSVASIFVVKASPVLLAARIVVALLIYVLAWALTLIAPTDGPA